MTPGSLSETRIFRPAFHQVLRQSFLSPRATYRISVPIQRSGDKLRASFRAGDGLLQLHAASIRTARSGATALVFGGRSGFKASATQTVQSDPVSIVTEGGTEILVAFEIEGSVAVSSFERFPDGSCEPGSHVFDPPGPSTASFRRGVGLVSIEVQGPGNRAIVAIGDSITEGYITGHDDIRNSWPMIAQRTIGHPVVSAAVSGQGVDDALRYLEEDVSSLEGITDCVILLGTNDLPDRSEGYIAGQLEEMARRLRATCQVWIGTILPKEWTPRGSYSLVEQRRESLNDRLRRSTSRVIDFDAALRDPLSPHRLRIGAGADGIHLSIAGQRLAAREVVRAMGFPVGTSVGAGLSAFEPR